MVRISTEDGVVSELLLDGDVDDYDWGYAPMESANRRTPAPERPSSLRIDAPESIRMNASFKATFRSPYRGRALVTLESNTVEDWNGYRCLLERTPLI